MTRRAYGLTLLACLAGAALALCAATRTWSLEVTPRTGMSDLRTTRTGADAEPWMIGLALVALAGTGALLATAGRARRLLGVVLALSGAGVAAGAIIGRAGLDPGEAGPGGTLWPAACVLAGAIITVGGVAAARHGHRWPTMSVRYDRNPAPDDRRPAPMPAAASPPSGVPGPAGTPLDHRAAWDALDRGDDPTV